MKRRKILALMTAILLICTLGFSACKPAPDDGKNPNPQPNPQPNPVEKTVTALGLETQTAPVENPGNNVTISVYSEGRVAAEDTGTLIYNQAFKKNDVYGGDIIRIQADYQYIKLQMLDMPESIIYSPTGEYVFQIPATGTPNWQRPYPANVFTRTSNTITASIPSAGEIAASRNLAANPYDFMYLNELNVTTATDLAASGSLPASSVSVEAGEVLAYPHAYANRITTGNDRGSFLARNAIDGDLRTGKGHINYGFQSWGGGRAPSSPTPYSAANNWGYYDDLTFVVYFGRPVTISELGFVMRADDTGTPAHDIAFSGMTAEFSDGSTQDLDGFTFEDTEQKRSITSVTTTYVRLKDFERAWDPAATGTAGNWTALSELTAYGTDASENQPAVKKLVRNTFGNKELAYQTDAFSATTLKEIIDFSSRDAQEVVKIKNSSKQPENWWRDGVLYSALLDAYTTAGSLDAYLYTQYASDRYQYTMQHHENGRGQVRAGLNSVIEGGFAAGTTRASAEVTDFADNYLVGESYLFMNELQPVKEGLNNYKLFNTYVNADAQMLNKPSWGQNFNTGNGYSNGGNAGPAKSDIRPLPENILDWWWCDAVYMGLNSYTLMTNATGDPTYAEKAFRTYEYFKSVLCCTEDNIYQDQYHHHDGNYGLWHRDMDTRNYGTLGDNAAALGNSRNFPGAELPAFWARGNAWVFAALAKQLLYLDQEQFPEMYETYKADFIRMAGTLKTHQRADGAWDPSIIAHEYRPGRESTGTSGFVYGMAIGVQLGVLAADEYMPVVENGFNALLDMCVQTAYTHNNVQIPAGRLGYMQDVGYDAGGYVGEEGQYSGGNASNAAKHATNAFGYGLFIHAATAVMRMCADYDAPWLAVPGDVQHGVAKTPAYYSGIVKA